MPHTDLVTLVEAIGRARVLCIGDAMIDHYIHGTVERISPEAPVPVLQIDSEERRLGGAGNVLRNLHGLGVEACFISVSGSDPAGRDLSRMGAELGAAQQLLRADRERVAPLSADLRGELMKLVRPA